MTTGAALLEAEPADDPHGRVVRRRSAAAADRYELGRHAGSTLTLVGKGVCFDTGGLNLKPGGSMGLMKKDMGGAATVLGLAHMIMGSEPRSCVSGC